MSQLISEKATTRQLEARRGYKRVAAIAVPGPYAVCRLIALYCETFTELQFSSDIAVSYLGRYVTQKAGLTSPALQTHKEVAF